MPPLDEGDSQPPPPSRRRRITGTERREVILEAARDVFVSCGYAGARTKDIAEGAGVTEALLYRHFDSKQQLFEEAVLAPIEAWVVTVAPDAAGKIVAAPTKEERETLTIAANEELCRTTLEIAPLLGVALFTGAEEGRDFYATRFRPLLAESIDTVGTSLVGWARPDVDPTILMMTGIGVYFAYALDRHFGGSPVDVPDVCRTYVDLLFNGISAPPEPAAPAPPPARKTRRA
jgi:AcrR family transcriptional regulator